MHPLSPEQISSRQAWILRVVERLRVCLGREPQIREICLALGMYTTYRTTYASSSLMWFWNPKRDSTYREKMQDFRQRSGVSRWGYRKPRVQG